MSLVSVIIPAYNEAATLPIFYRRLTQALAPLQGRANFEFLVVNNGSTDESLAILQDLHRSDPRVQVLTLSRNFGYQAAITAGLTVARGDAVACIDADGEDPPRILAQFVETWLEGKADVVYGIRGKRPESRLMQLGRRAYYRITRMLADHEIVLDMAEFGLLDRRVRDAVLSTRSTFPFVRAQVGYVGFRRIGIPYDREARLGGRSHYNLLRAFKFGLGGILSSSTFPLRLLAYGGAVLVLLGVSAVTAAAVAHLRNPSFNPSTWILLGIAVLLVWTVFGIGVLAVYLARVYKDLVALPLYVVDEARSLLGARGESRKG
jgi:glycosyltransferase involved in cell wall biosynthesis